MRLDGASQSNLGVASRGGVAVPDVVQVDLWEAGRLGQLLEAAGNRVRVRRLAVLPAERLPATGG
jgi:hypothetical protein